MLVDICQEESVAFVTSKAYNGDPQLNPYNFQHFNISYIVCYLDGEQYPLKAYQPNFEKGTIIREFMGLYEAANQN